MRSSSNAWLVCANRQADHTTRHTGLIIAFGGETPPEVISQTLMVGSDDICCSVSSPGFYPMIAGWLREGLLHCETQYAKQLKLSFSLPGLAAATLYRSETIPPIAQHEAKPGF
jgi:hypothetical protein